MSRKHKNRIKGGEVKITSVGDGRVKCIYCGTKGHRDEITIDPDTNLERKTFHCLPRELTGSTEGIQAVCIHCTFTHRENLRKQFLEWFQDHTNLPVLVHWIQREEEWGRKYPPAMARVKKYKEMVQISDNKELVCSRCGRFHGQITQTSDLPNLRFDCANVSWVLGHHKTRKGVMSSLICGYCREVATQTVRTFFLGTTLKIVEDREEQQRQRRLANQPEPKKVELVTVIAPAVIRHEPLAPRIGGKNIWQGTGTYGKGPR